MSAVSAFAPVVLLAFANDQGSYLENLVRERKAIAEGLQQFEDQRYLRVHVEPNAGIDDLFALFGRFANQLAIFHYGGHANGSALRLEANGGANETAHAGGLAQILGQLRALKLVFLNGCATRDQVKRLLEAGVPAVIATSAKIDDSAASSFAAQLYARLGEGRTIAESFAAARAGLATREGERRTIDAFRAMDVDGEESAPGSDALTWGLYTRPDDAGDAALGWTLPQVAETEVVIGATHGGFGAPAAEPNAVLRQTLFNAVARHNETVFRRLEQARDNSIDDVRVIPASIYDNIPAPVGEHIRMLFSLAEPDLQRLRQLARTYEIAAKFLAFALASQIWNARLAQPGFALSDIAWEQLDAFHALDPAAEASFDHLGLALALIAGLEENGVFPFMAESAGLPAALLAQEPAEARAFLKELREQLAAGDPPVHEVERLCFDGERHLAALLAEMAFIAGYKLAVVKQIAITKARNRPATYRQTRVELDQISLNMFADVSREASGFSDNQAVLLFRSLAHPDVFLNLTPFLLDPLAIRNRPGAQLFFLRSWSAEQQEATYHLVVDPTVTLVVSGTSPDRDSALFAPIREQLSEFRRVVARP